jgi:hypothetical protein
MGLLEETLGLLSGMEKMPGLPAADQQMIQEKIKTLPGLLSGITTIWPKLEKQQELSQDDLQSLYEMLRKSGAGAVAPFESLMHGLNQKVSPDVLTPKELYQWGIDLDRLSPRVPGTIAMDHTVQYLVDTLRAFGIETWTEPLNFKGVFFRDWSFEIVAPFKQTFVCFPENNVGFGEVTAALVDVGRGKESDYQGKDVRGKIVFVDWGGLWDHEGPCALRDRYGLLHLYDLAFAHGAAGMVGYFDDTPGNTLKLVEPGIKPTGGSNVWGQAETGPDHQFKLPVLNIGREDGLAIKAMLKEKVLEARLVVKGVRKVSTTQFVVGLLPGRTSQTIACGAHSCTAFEGAICDTVGVVGTLALAKYFASRPIEEREKTMLFFFDSFHVWGNCCQAAVMLLNRHRTLASCIESLLWLDHIGDGRADSPRLSITSDNPVFWPLITLAMAKRGIMPIALPIGRIWSLCATGAFERQGIPTMTMQALNDITLTPEDTWDKFDPAVLFRDVMMHIELAQALHMLSVPHNAPGEPVGGCGALFTEPVMPDYPPKEQYVPEPAYPLYVGGEHVLVSVLKTPEEKQAFVGKTHQ